MNLLTRLAVITACSSALAFQPSKGVSASSAPPTLATVARINEIKIEMQSLDGSNAQRYFDLGEELAEIHVTFADAKLAQALLVHAFELDRLAPRSTDQRVALAPAACVLLTKVSPARDREWLLSVAATLDNRYAAMAKDGDVSSVSPTVALQVASLLGAVRAGDGVTARGLAGKPGVVATLNKYERLLTGGQPGGASRIVDAAGRWPCSNCLNERYIVKAKTPAAAAEARVCPVCKGRPGLALTETELINQLRLESRLLSGIQSSWSAIVMADGDTPLRDPDPKGLARALGVDLARPFFRDGVWMNQTEKNAGRTGAEILQGRQPRGQPSLITPNVDAPGPAPVPAGSSGPNYTPPGAK
jgi:hypothetical protein